MTDAELKEIRERAEKATQGPWVVKGSQFGMQVWTDQGDGSLLRVCSFDKKDDSEFIAHARTDIPRLLDCIQGLKADLAQTREGFKWLESENKRLRKALEGKC